MNGFLKIEYLYVAIKQYKYQQLNLSSKQYNYRKPVLRKPVSKGQRELSL